MNFKCYSSEELITLNTLHEVVPTWYIYIYIYGIYMEKIMNDEVDLDYNVERDAMKFPV